MRNYITKLSREEFIKLYPELTFELNNLEEFPKAIAIHTNYPEDTYFKRDIGTNTYAAFANVDKALLKRNYVIVQQSNGYDINVPRDETKAFYLIFKEE